MTAADLVVLSLLSERAMHGYELLREYERQEVRDWASVSRAHVYYAIQKLSALALIDAGERGGRAKTVYSVGANGAAALADALGRASWATSRIPDPFATWLALSIHARHDDVVRIVQQRHAFLVSELTREQMTLLEINADQGARIVVAQSMVTLTIRQLELEIAWLEEFSSQWIADNHTV
ncbi:PadR family transcriptional regulator [uncultured Devosia sp.]|uniref:PadR family transcriptional regulator n=1 Tax=uncultured Devosia sp. TaxID=211434 RepID=UPI0035CBCECD